MKNNKTFVFLKKFVTRFFRYNTRYRIFILVLFGFCNLPSYYNKGFWTSLISSFFLTVFETLILVFILDKQFNREIRLLIKQHNEKRKKEQEKERKEWAESWDFIKFMIKESFNSMVAVIINFLTRFSFFSNLYRNKPAHYDYRYIRQLCKYIDKNCKGLYVNAVDIDKYYCILSLASTKSISSQNRQSNKQDEVIEVIKKYFKEDSQDIIVRSKGHLLQLLVPTSDLFQ